MLQLILVKNYAVIDEVELEFDAGFSVLTGETGAGKSILVDALGLVLGDRADASTVRHGAERAEVSVLFECPSDHPAAVWLEAHGLDDEGRCALRRLVTREGRSRAFINNQPVTLQDLRLIGGLLVDIHGQHAHQSLLHSATQRELLDAHGELTELAAQTAATFAAFKQAAAERDAQQARSSERDAQLELLRFQVAELEQLALEDGEQQALTAEQSRLANVDRLLQGLNESLDRLYESDDGAAYAQVAQARRTLEGLLEHDPGLQIAAERLAAAEIELQEAASDLARYRERLEADPQRLDYVSGRLAKIRALARRHRVEDGALAGLLPVLHERLEGGREIPRRHQQPVDATGVGARREPQVGRVGRFRRSRRARFGPARRARHDARAFAGGRGRQDGRSRRRERLGPNRIPGSPEPRPALYRAG